jgi:predicted O-methyltransferase YrrM
VHGWLDYRDHYDNIAKTLRDGDTFVEVGTWLGKSIIYLAQRLQDIGKPNVKIHCVDVFDFNGESFANTFITNIRNAKVDSMITIHETNSVAASELFAESSIDAIYIDAAHDYDSVKEDLQAWFGKVKKGGIFSGHDWTCADVQKAVEEHSQANGYELATHNNYWKRK